MREEQHSFGLTAVAVAMVLGAGCALDETPEPVRSEPEIVITPRRVDTAGRTFAPPAPCLGPRCETVVEVASGRAHTCALMSSGRVVGWGSGDGAPREVPGLHDAIALAAGGDRSCAVRSGGTVWCWDGAVSPAARVSGVDDAVTVAVSDELVVAARGDGTLVNVSRGRDAEVLRGARGIVEVDVAGPRACARTDGGDVACWLAGDSHVTPLALANVRQIAMGDAHQCVLVAGAEVRCWGEDVWGMVGLGVAGIVEEPTPVSDVRGALAIAAGKEHTCALLPGTQVRCWGRNHRGQVDPSRRAFDDYWAERTPVAVSGLSAVRDVVMVSPGSQHTCALRARGGIVCWGANREGQLGDGSVETRDGVVEVRGLRGGRSSRVE
ncbi:MAG: hypothetical protein IT379_04615 [Deltaproteobacteria bacterium]|nr:hypothetical protein [Deltaproteobacteria bacterium]